MKILVSLPALLLVAGVAAMPAAALDSGKKLTIAQAAAPAAPPAARPAAQMSGDLFIRNAIATVQALDAGGASSIYDAASAAMKNSTTKANFAAAVTATNTRIGRVVSREWGRVERLQVAAPTPGTAATVPAGSYVTVFLVARNAAGVNHLEQISFRLDEDNQWRLAGVTTHSTQPTK